jgi:hypothetical protein
VTHRISIIIGIQEAERAQALKQVSFRQQHKLTLQKFGQRLAASLILCLCFSTPLYAQRVTNERVGCSLVAAQQYGLPANILLAVAEQEGGRPGQWVRNTNGTYDLGALQFNTSYIASLRRYNISPADVTAAGCYPYQLAAWRIRRHIQYDSGDIWTRVANYHSRTPVYNARYRASIMERARRWHFWLQRMSGQQIASN